MATPMLRTALLIPSFTHSPTHSNGHSTPLAVCRGMMPSNYPLPQSEGA